MTFYRTYRSNTFSEVIGQPPVVATLQQALIQNRLTHAYLFSGPRGTGKTSTARIFARASVCLTPITSKTTYEPCNNCENCLNILSGQTSDFQEIDAASNRGIEDIRELREQTKYRPTQLKRKIYIIDEVHMLTPEAFNALLKTLEEPPEYCIFILATTEPHKVPLTIRSRCQLLRFDRGSRQSIEQKLQSIITKEHLKVDADALSLIAEHAEGGFRDAETTLENLSTRHSHVTLKAVEEALGILADAEIKQLISASLTGDLEQTTTLLSAYTSNLPGSLERLTSQLIEQIRNLLYSKNQNHDIPPSLLIYSLEQLLEAYILQKNSPLPSLPLEIALLSICQHVIPAEQKLVIVAPAFVQPKVAVKQPVLTASETPVLITKPEPAPISEVPVIELRTEGMKDIRKAWKLMIDQVCLENLVLGKAIKETIFHTAEQGLITIYVRYKFHADKMNEKKNKIRINQLLEDYTGEVWDVHYVINNTMPKHRPNKAVGPGIDEAKAIFG